MSAAPVAAGGDRIPPPPPDAKLIRPPHAPAFYTKGHKVITFIETCCVLTNGRWRGRPFTLQDWQKRLILRLFTVEYDPEEGCWLRRYRWALIGVPKKNGKTELAAALALYLLIADEEPAPLIACAAGSEEQADLVFGAAKIMCEESPRLAALTEVFTGEILVPQRPGARLIRVAAVAGRNDGKNLHGVICDELHEWAGAKGRAVWDTLTNGTGARLQPLIIQITTAGWDLDTICGEQYLKGKANNEAAEQGLDHDRRYYFEWWAPGDDDPYDKEATWRAANPSYGVTVRPSFYRDQLNNKRPAVFERYFLNRWTGAEETWFEPGVWEACAVPDLPFDPDRPAWVAIDAATKHDTCAVVLGQWLELSGALRLCVKAWVWARPLDPRTMKPIAGWKLPIGEVKAHLRSLHARYDVKHFGYDPHYITWVAQELENDGLPMLEIPQSDSRMGPACQSFYEFVQQGILAHDGDPELAAHVRNIVAVPAASGNGAYRIKKGQARNKIDAAVAVAMICGRDLAQTPPEPDPGPQIWIGDDDDDE